MGFEEYCLNFEFKIAQLLNSPPVRFDFTLYRYLIPTAKAPDPNGCIVIPQRHGKIEEIVLDELAPVMNAKAVVS